MPSEFKQYLSKFTQHIELEEQIRKLEAKYQWLYPHTLLRFGVHVAEHCNLNCKNCGHFSPLAKEEYLDIEQYKKDCARLSELFGGEVKFVSLLGGEPLLNPDLVEIMRITREAFPIGKIKIETNGTLFPAMKEEFWRACKEYNVILCPTEYPIDFDYDKWREYAEEREITYKPLHFYNYCSSPDKKAMRRQLLSPQKHYVGESNYYHCHKGNHCISLQKGRLYTCIAPAYIHHLKKFFNVDDFHVSERDSVDIYAVKDAEELMEKLNKPIPFCQYCNIASFRYEEAWGTTCKDRYEWIDFEWTKEDIQYLKAASSVYVYGAGKRGTKTVQRLNKYAIPVRAVLVSSLEGNPSEVLGVPVEEAKNVHPGGGGLCACLQ